MIKRRNIILSFALISTLMLTGCSGNGGDDEGAKVSFNKTINVNNVKIPAAKPLKRVERTDVAEYKSYESIEGFERIKGYRPYEEGDDFYSNMFILPGYPASPTGDDDFYYDYDGDLDITKYYLIGNRADKIKGLLGKDIKLVSAKNSYITDNPEAYFVKGYANAGYDLKEERYIMVNLQEEVIGEDYSDERYHPVNGEKIEFYASADSPEKTLKLFLSMEKEIKTMLENLLIKEDVDEVYKFLLEEVGRNNANPTENSGFSIDINEGMSLGYNFDGKDDEYNCAASFVFYSEGDYDEEKRVNIDNKPTTLEELVFANYDEKTPNDFYLNYNLDIVEFDEVLLADVYKKEIEDGTIDWDGVSDIEDDIEIYYGDKGEVTLDVGYFRHYVSLIVESDKNNIDFAISQIRRVLDKMFVVNPNIEEVIVKRVTDIITKCEPDTEFSIELNTDSYRDIQLSVYCYDDGEYKISIG